jgi:hypothetical protein
MLKEEDCTKCSVTLHAEASQMGRSLANSASQLPAEKSPKLNTKHLTQPCLEKKAYFQTGLFAPYWREVFSLLPKMP